MTLAISIAVNGQPDGAAKARAVVDKAVQFMGGERYLQVKTQVGKGRFTLINDRGIYSSQTFVDVIAFPDKERTDFKGGGSRSIQTNDGSTGWIYDSDLDVVKDQTPVQVENFRQGIRSSLDNVLRGYWKGDAEMTYVGKRPGTLGKRNDVVRLTYKDGFSVEFEFADDGTPQKALFKRTNAAGEEVKEEDRYAMFIDVAGVKAPLVVDRYTDGKQASRINYESVVFDKPVPASIFARPASPKEAKKDIKL